MPRLRRVVFTVFALFYCFFCPLLVLYAFGTIFKPGTERGIVKTGLISLATTPEGASVYLENRRYTRKTPSIIRDLLPGDYFVKVSLKNYRSWARVISVEEEKAIAFEKILLLPKQWKPRTLIAGPFEDLIPLRRSRFFLLARRTGLWGEKKLLRIEPDSKGVKVREVDGDFSHDLVLSEEPVLFWGRKGTGRVRGVEQDPRTGKILLWREDRLGVLDPSPAGAEIRWIFNKGRRISQAFWAHEASHVLFLDGEGLHLLELENYGRADPRDLFGVRRGSSIIYDEESGRIYYLEEGSGALCAATLLPGKETFFGI